MSSPLQPAATADPADSISGPVMVSPGRTPPRFLVKAFWYLHRGLYRISGGRAGLTRPTAGSRFGMLRLVTVGRYSGRERVAIIGYYEDGANLVTIAMNGWGRSDPAWWLNLQAQPETVVRLADGPRAVRARAATGAERDRLWARFSDFPGWGKDLDRLVARRPGPTTIVVFEPAGTSASALGPEGDREALSHAAASRVATPASEKPASGGRLNARHLLLVPGLGVSFAASFYAGEHALGLVPLLVFGIAPHLPALAGLGQSLAPHQLAPRAVPLFNALHHPAAPIALAALAAVGILSPFWLAGGLAWLSHIVVDRALGDGPRTADGFRVRPSDAAAARAATA